MPTLSYKNANHSYVRRRRRRLSMGLKNDRNKSSSNPQERQQGAAAAAAAAEISLVKAAAWAWYQHGSGSCSGNDSRPPADPRPSRHKLETLSPPGSLLLDLYEVEQITKELNQLIVSCRRDDTAAGSSSAGAAIKERNGERPAEGKASRRLMRIGLCRPGAADVIEASVVAGGGRRIRRGAQKWKEGANG